MSSNFTSIACYYFSFHLDHCGGLPYFLEKTAFKGRCFMTHASKAIYRWLLSDYVKVRYHGAGDSFSSDFELLNQILKSEMPFLAKHVFSSLYFVSSAF